jgi:hypothetical protein
LSRARPGARLLEAAARPSLAGVKKIGLLAAAALLAGAAPPAPVAGVWDLEWKNAHGATRSAWLLMRQRGERIECELHGRHEVNAAGRIEGGRFELRGSRLLIPYRIIGRVEGGRMEGAVAAPGFERHFVGVRRRG